MPFPITSCISLTANIWLSSSFISIRACMFPGSSYTVYLYRTDEKAKQATIRYGLNSLVEVHYRYIQKALPCNEESFFCVVLLTFLIYIRYMRLSVAVNIQG